MAKNTLTFWGVRGSHPTPYSSHLKVGGNTSCIELNINNQCFICDAGTGLIPLGKDLLKRKNQHFYLLITHYHWDHISGLPFFVPAFIPSTQMSIFGPGKDNIQIEENISGQMKPPYFPVETESWLADIEYLSPNLKQINSNNVTVTPFTVHHPGTTYGFCFEYDNKKIVYMPDNEFAFLDKNIDEQIKNCTEQQEVDLLLMLKEEYRQQSLNTIRHADILIHDSQYTIEDYQGKRGWGHSNYIDTVEMAINAKVKYLYIFHLDPSYDDDKAETIYQHCLQIIKDHNSPLKCVIAREGLTINL